MRLRSAGLKLLMLAVTIGLIVYFGIQLQNYMDNPLSTSLAYAYAVDEGVEVSGYLVRQESVLQDESGALLRLQRSEGERVSVGGVIAAVYADQASLDRQSDIDALEVRIAQLEYAQEAAYSYEANVKLDNQISQSIRELRTALVSDRLDTAERRGSELRALVLKRDYTYTGTEDLSVQLEELRAQLRDLTSQTARSVRRITAPAAGLYSAVVDGYETLLTPDTLGTLTPSALASLRADPAVSSNVGKLILGDSWYYAASVPTNEIKALREAPQLTLRFSKGVEQDLPVTILSVGPEEGGRSVVVFQGKTYLAQLTLLRQQSAQVIRCSYEGIRIPAEALRVRTVEKKNEDGTTTKTQETGIYCIMGARARFKPVDILYRGEGFLLVRSTSQQAGRMLRIGDEVIVTANDLADGKVVRTTK